MDQWFAGLSAYLQSTGTLKETPNPQGYITDKYQKMVKDDPKLLKFALGQ